jgi:hypothetical protein
MLHCEPSAAIFSENGVSVVASRVFNSARLAEMRAWARYFNIAKVAAFIGILAAPFSLWALFWTSPRDYPFLSSMVYLPILTYCCIMLFSRVWKNDKFVKLLFGAGIGIRVAAAGAFVWMGFFVFNVAVDAFHYWTVGLALANEFNGVGWNAFRPPWTSTNLVCNLCGLLTLAIGNAMPTLFVLFAFAALWGAYFFYRAFCISFPHGNRGLYGVLLVLLPSMVYWSSAIGKDALEQLFIGLSVYGFARIIKQVNAWSIAIFLIGLSGAALVRPHAGAMLATSMLLPFTVGQARGGWLTISLKVLLVPILAAGTFYMVSQAQSFVGVEGSDFRSNVNRLKLESEVTNLGGSTFNRGESLPLRIIQGPFLIFRPWPWEVHNAVTAVASLEGLALFILTWRKRRDACALLRHWRDAYVLFVLIFTLEFSVIFSAATSNFGILVRERIMLVPVVLVLFCAKHPVSRSVAGLPPAHRNYWFRSRLPAPELDRSLS